MSERAADYFEMPGRAEFIAAAFLFALMLGFKAVNMLRYRFDTDESQHLHVIWGWANGFIQYPDLCDNHMPLFQILVAPINRVIGARADVYWMRFPSSPCLSTWRPHGAPIGSARSAFPNASGSWAVIVAGF